MTSLVVRESCARSCGSVGGYRDTTSRADELELVVRESCARSCRSVGGYRDNIQSGRDIKLASIIALNTLDGATKLCGHIGEEVI
jgi:hypothetical protein